MDSISFHFISYKQTTPVPTELYEPTLLPMSTSSPSLSLDTLSSPSPKATTTTPVAQIIHDIKELRNFDDRDEKESPVPETTTIQRVDASQPPVHLKGFYRHYKHGHIYYLKGLSLSVPTQEWMASYVDVKNRSFVRSWKEFTEIMDGSIDENLDRFYPAYFSQVLNAFEVSKQSIQSGDGLKRLEAFLKEHM